ncbi:unnamed protein product, partial [Ascophyllum nodosum]
AAGNAPPLELKTIDSGSDAAYNDALQDKELQDRVKAEMDCSANLRSATGSC